MKLEVGKHYEVITSLERIAKGSIVEIIKAEVPVVTLVKGWCDFTGTFHISKKHLKPIEKVTNKFPDYSFKVSTEGFNVQELEAAYEWLKECAISLNLDSSAIDLISERRYYFHKTLRQWVTWDRVSDNNYPSLPEIKLNMKTVTRVTGYSLTESNQETKLKEIICNLQQSLEEARSELANLKGIRERV